MLFGMSLKCLVGNVLEDRGRRTSACTGGNYAHEYKSVWQRVSLGTGKSILKVSAHLLG